MFVMLKKKNNLVLPQKNQAVVKMSHLTNYQLIFYRNVF